MQLNPLITKLISSIRRLSPQKAHSAEIQTFNYLNKGIPQENLVEELKRFLMQISLDPSLKKTETYKVKEASLDKLKLETNKICPELLKPKKYSPVNEIEDKNQIIGKLEEIAKELQGSRPAGKISIEKDPDFSGKKPLVVLVEEVHTGEDRETVDIIIKDLSAALMKLHSEFPGRTLSSEGTAQWHPRNIQEARTTEESLPYVNQGTFKAMIQVVLQNKTRLAHLETPSEVLKGYAELLAQGLTFPDKYGHRVGKFLENVMNYTYHIDSSEIKTGGDFKLTRNESAEKLYNHNISELIDEINNYGESQGIKYNVGIQCVKRFAGDYPVLILAPDYSRCSPNDMRNIEAYLNNKFYMRVEKRDENMIPRVIKHAKDHDFSTALLGAMHISDKVFEGQAVKPNYKPKLVERIKEAGLDYVILRTFNPKEMQLLDLG